MIVLGTDPVCVSRVHISFSSNTLTVFLALSFIQVFGFYRPGLRDWGPVDGTQTGTFDLSFYYYYQNSKKKQTYLPVSAVIPPPDGWIQHSVPHGKLL